MSIISKIPQISNGSMVDAVSRGSSESLIPRKVQLLLKYLIKDRTMDNVQNCDSYINISSSQTYR
jgi:hypothetical protein